MKARTPQPVVSEAEIRNKIKTYVAEEKIRIYNEISEDVISQMMAIVLGTLEMQYGFRKVRLQRFNRNLISYAQMMSNEYFGKDATDIKEHIKDKYGIDTEETASTIYGGVSDDVQE